MSTRLRPRTGRNPVKQPNAVRSPRESGDHPGCGCLCEAGIDIAWATRLARQPVAAGGLHHAVHQSRHLRLHQIAHPTTHNGGGGGGRPRGRPAQDRRVTPSSLQAYTALRRAAMAS